MSDFRYLDENLAFDHNKELLREAQNARLARAAAAGNASRSPVLPRLLGWLGEQAGALSQQTEAWARKSRSLASQKLSYLDNPDPFKNCATC